MTPSQGITSLYTYSIGINSTSGNNTNQQLYQEHAYKNEHASLPSVYVERYLSDIVERMTQTLASNILAVRHLPHD